MTATEVDQEVRDIVARARKLPAALQESIANQLLDSVEADEGYTEEELADELQRRWDEYKRGDVQAIPIEEFQAELRQRIAERRGS